MVKLKEWSPFVISGLAVQIRPWAPLDNKRAISLIALFYILS